MNALDVFLQPATCRKCGKEFITRDARVRYCSDDCRPHNREEIAAKMRLYRATLDPETVRRINREHYLTNGKNALKKSQTMTCTVCGRAKRRSHMTVQQRANYVCGKCQVLARRALLPPENPCRSCGKLAGYNAAKRPRLICIECRGEQIELAEQINVTHQRVSQLVAAEIRNASERGEAITQADAIANIRRKRGVL